MNIPLNILIGKLKHGYTVATDTPSNEEGPVQELVPPTHLTMEAARHLVKLQSALERMTKLALDLQTENDYLLQNSINSANTNEKVSNEA